MFLFLLMCVRALAFIRLCTSHRVCPRETNDNVGGGIAGTYIQSVPVQEIILFSYFVLRMISDDFVCFCIFLTPASPFKSIGVYAAILCFLYFLFFFFISSLSSSQVSVLRCCRRCRRRCRRYALL